jgi:hypothetical protein
MAKCVQCGYCCTVGTCGFGLWDPKKKQCAFLLEDNLCQKYYEIKDLPDAEMNPAFGTGCSSTLGNTCRNKIITERRRILKEKHGTPIEFAKACSNAVPDFISPREADEAVEKYKQEWNNV